MNSQAPVPSRINGWWPSLCIIGMLSGCAASMPKNALRLPESTLDMRSIQTRTFEAPSENDILTATVAALQDMEYNIDLIEKPLGVITASKVSDADSTGEMIALTLWEIACIVSETVGCHPMSSAMDEQRITVTMVVLPSLARSGEFVTRITIQRVIFDKTGQVKVMERIDDAETYQQVFENLSKAIFIQIGEK